jgi:hypothetical protein
MAEGRKEMPIFVKIDEYKDILDVLGLMKHKIAETKAVMGRLNEIKNEEDSELEQWKLQLEEIERKVNFIDKTLFEPQAY